jgi:hypothetical protein
MMMDGEQEHIHNWVYHSTDNLVTDGRSVATMAKVYTCDNHRLHENATPAFLCKSIQVIWPNGDGKIAEIAHAFADDSGTGHPLIVGTHIPKPMKAVSDT